MSYEKHDTPIIIYFSLHEVIFSKQVIIICIDILHLVRIHSRVRDKRYSV